MTAKGEDEGDATTITKNSNFNNKMPESRRFINKNFKLEYGRTNRNTIKAFQANHVPRTFALFCCGPLKTKTGTGVTRDCLKHPILG